MEYFTYPVISSCDEDKYRKCDDEGLLHFTYEMIDLIANKKYNTPRTDQINLICNNMFGNQWFQILNILFELSKNKEYSASEEYCKFEVNVNKRNCIKDKSNLKVNATMDDSTNNDNNQNKNANSVDYIGSYNFIDDDNNSNDISSDDEDYDDDDDDDENDDVFKDGDVDKVGKCN
jgi:hypothetical protein